MGDSPDAITSIEVRKVIVLALQTVVWFGLVLAIFMLRM